MNQEPAQLEAEGIEEVKVEYKGHVYVFPASLEDAPLKVTRAIEDQKLTYAIEHLLGEEQWGEFFEWASNKDAADLFNGYAAAIGLPTAPE